MSSLMCRVLERDISQFQNKARLFGEREREREKERNRYCIVHKVFSATFIEGWDGLFPIRNLLLFLS